MKALVLNAMKRKTEATQIIKIVSREVAEWPVGINEEPDEFHVLAYLWDIASFQ